VTEGALIDYPYIIFLFKNHVKMRTSDIIHQAFEERSSLDHHCIALHYMF